MVGTIVVIDDLDPLALLDSRRAERDPSRRE
jgi:hypothetical protein